MLDERAAFGAERRSRGLAVRLFQRSRDLALERANVVHGAMQRVLIVIDLHGQRELLLQSLERALDARIGPQRQRRRVRLPVVGEPDGVLPGERDRPARRQPGIERARNLRWIVVAQIPREAVHALRRRQCIHRMHLVRPFRRLLGRLRLDAREMSHHAAGGVEDIEADRTGRPRRQVVIDESSGGRVLTRRRTIIDLVGIVEPIAGLGRVEVGRRGVRRGRDLAQRSHVAENPE